MTVGGTERAWVWGNPAGCASGSAHRVGQGLGQIGVGVGEAGIQQPDGDDALAGQDEFFGHLSQGQAQDEAGHGQPRGAMQRAAQGFCRSRAWSRDPGR